MADIFISYKSERRPAARHLKKVLECYFQTGVEECVWYDYGLIPGHDFEPRIMAELKKAKVVLVLWCGRAVRSDWVRREAREAHRTGKFLPIRIEPCSLPGEFGGADTINLSDWDASPCSPTLHRLLDDIGRRLGREAASRISRLREVQEDWENYGAPTLASFALGKTLAPETTPEPVRAHQIAAILGPPTAGVSPNLAQHWANAQQGDAAALVEVAWHFADGKGGLVKDEREAFRLCKLASDQGDAEAQDTLGFMYQTGRGTASDNREAFRLYTLAAQKGHAGAQYNLGRMYEAGSGVPKDDREAARLTKLAADQGHLSALYRLANMYAEGCGVPKDEQEARRLSDLFLRVATEKNREAVRRDMIAADQGDADAQCALAHRYAIGGGVPRDEREAVRLCKLAAAQGNANGQRFLGEMYASGCGLAKDEREAARLFKLAADQGDANAQVLLGSMYEEGRGVAKDANEAARLYKLAGDKRDTNARLRLAMRELWRGDP